MRNLAPDKTKKQEDSTRRRGPLWPGGQQGLYKADVREWAPEGEGLRKGLEMKNDTAL